jgi:hypothetical protein
MQKAQSLLKKRNNFSPILCFAKTPNANHGVISTDSHQYVTPAAIPQSLQQQQVQ